VLRGHGARISAKAENDDSAFPVPDPDSETDEWLVSGCAYRFFGEVDLAPDLRDGEDAVGEIHFIDGCHPGDGSLRVEVSGLLSLSLLQERLNQLDTDIGVVPHGAT